MFYILLSFFISDVGTKVAIIVIVVVLVVVLVGGLLGWVYYAYTHPTSASGMWLMEVSENWVLFKCRLSLSYSVFRQSFGFYLIFGLDSKIPINLCEIDYDYDLRLQLFLRFLCKGVKWILAGPWFCLKLHM